MIAWLTLHDQRGEDVVVAIDRIACITDRGEGSKILVDAGASTEVWVRERPGQIVKMLAGAE